MKLLGLPYRHIALDIGQINVYFILVPIKLSQKDFRLQQPESADDEIATEIREQRNSRKLARER